MIESMACGTPVIAFNRGSVPEVIDDGLTGFIVHDEATAIAAVDRLGELDRADGQRQPFDRRFTARRMAEDYLDLYEELCEPQRAVAARGRGLTASATSAAYGIRAGQSSLPGPFAFWCRPARYTGRSTMTPLRSQVGLNAPQLLSSAPSRPAFGPFFTVYLTQQGWNQVDIGFALSVGTAAALILQLPAGALVDAIHLKRVAIAVGSAADRPQRPGRGRGTDRKHGPGVAQVLQAFAGCLLTPAIAALTLEAVRPRCLRRAARHQRPLCLTRQCCCRGGAGRHRLLCVGTARCSFSLLLLIVPALATLLACSPQRSRPRTTIRPRMHPRVRKQSPHRPWHIFPDRPCIFSRSATAVPIRQRRDAAAGAQ